MAAALERDYPDDNIDVTVMVQTLHDRTVGNVRLALVVLLGAVAMVLLIACANVANLRARARRRAAATRWPCAPRSAPDGGRLALVPADREPRARRRRRRARARPRRVGHRRAQGAGARRTCRDSTTCSSMFRRSCSRARSSCATTAALRTGAVAATVARAAAPALGQRDASAPAARAGRVPRCSSPKSACRSCCCSAPGCCCAACGAAAHRPRVRRAAT